MPQYLPLICVHASGEQAPESAENPQTFVNPAPPQVCVPGQPPQSVRPPQPSPTMPQYWPLVCAQTNGQYCGIVGDGCGGRTDCGGCPGTQTCGGAGLTNVCGFSADSGACSPLACTQMSGKYCGIVGNSCGGQQDCGGC